MAFEKFEGSKLGSGRKSTVPYVSITNYARIYINAAATRKWFENIKAAYLHYDASNSKIGIEPVSKGFRALCVARNRAMCMISGKSFFRYFNIPFPDKTTCYPAEWDTELSMMVIDLTKPKE